MKKSVLLFAFLLSVSFLFSQVPDLIDEGIALHDKGNYEDAIKKYDEALAQDPSSFHAIYEKSYTLMAMQRYDDAEKLLKKILKECKDDQYRLNAYVNYGTLLDYGGKAKKSIEMYDKGIKEYPDEYMLYFNKGITLSGMNENEDAISNFKTSARLNPVHASSHNALGRLQMNSNRIAATISFFTFLLIEPEGQRAKENSATLYSLFMQGVSKNENGDVTINVSADLLKPKKKETEDDFSRYDFLLSLLAVPTPETEDSLGIKTEADRMNYRMDMLVGIIQDKMGKGFYYDFYIPMLKEMKEKDLLHTACYIALTSYGDEAITKWLEENEDKVDQFYTWFKFYKWKP